MQHMSSSGFVLSPQWFILFIGCDSSRLPPGADLQHVSSLLSGDGVLSVEAPVPGTATGHPATEIVIPIQTSEACGQKM